jgi:autocrine motility factor receptor
MAYCCLILLGKFIQKLVFGELRVSEQQHIKDKFWNFVFYKFIFVFGVINVQYMDEVVLWCSWFSVLGFLHLLAQLCKDRFEYVSVIVFPVFKIDCIVLCSLA